MALKATAVVAIALAAASPPEQVKLSPTGRAGEMHVSFVTVGECEAGHVTWMVPAEGGGGTAPASCSYFTEGMTAPISVYAAVMTSLPPAAEVDYVLTAGGVDSETFNFTQWPGVRRQGGGPKVYAVFADFGLAEDVSLANLLAASAAGEFDACVWPGDFAYDLYTAGGSRGNDFMNALQPMLSQIPLFSAPGNHEHQSGGRGFAAYTARFPELPLLARNSASDSGMYYSFNDGDVHFVLFDTELYHYGGADRDAQLAWLKADLAGVDRRVTNWVVAGGHKCGTWMDELGAANWTELEDVLYAGHVDVQFCGHVHNYQRLLPQKHNVVEDDGCVSEDEATYTDCRSTAYFVVGSPGCREKISTGRAPHGVAKQVLAYGYGRLTVHNATALQWTWTQTGSQDPVTLAYTPVPRASAQEDEAWIYKAPAA